MREALNTQKSLKSCLPLNSFTLMNSPKPDDSPWVTAIVVTHNGAGTIQTCVESLLGSQLNPDHRFDVHGTGHSLSGSAVSQPKTCQGSQPLRVIVVDNASTDETPRILNQYTSTRRIEVIRLQSNIGFGAGNNTGIRRALQEGAEYCFLLNQDAFVESDTIARLVGVMEEHTDIGVLSPLHMNGDGDGLEWHFVEYGLKTTKEGRNWLETGSLEKRQHETGWPWLPGEMSGRPVMGAGRSTPADKNPVPVKFVNAAAWMVRRSCFEEAGGFHPAFFMYSEDVEFLQRVHSLGFGVGVAVDCAVIHDRSENERRERRGIGLKNDPLRVHKGAVLSVALHPRYSSKEKLSVIRFKTIRFMARLIRQGKLGAACRVWGATKEARKLMHSNVFEDARQSLFS